MTTGTTGREGAQSSLSSAFPLASRLNERGRLEVGGCDAVELAREYGTPAYVVAEDDLRARAQAFLEQKAVDLSALKDVLERHHLMDNWLRFCAKAGIENPLKSP